MTPARGSRSRKGGPSKSIKLLVAVGVVGLAALAVDSVLSDFRPKSWRGLTYGTAATVLMVAAALFGWRRRSMSFSLRRGLGRSRTWLRVHIYGGALFFLLVLMHTGFRLPSGTMLWWLWLLSLWTTVSGLVGLALQNWIPRVLNSGLAIEVHYSRIRVLIEEIRERAEELVRGSKPIGALYSKSIAPALAGPQRRMIYYVDITGGIQSRVKELRHLRGMLAPDEATKLDELEQLYRTKLEIDAHYTLQWPLRAWLYLHVPTSLILVALVAVHLFSVLYY